MSERAPIRVLVADDHRLFREGVQALLASLSGLEVVAVAEDGAAAVEAARASQPDVILMDVQMPGLNGLEATRRILAERPEVGVVVVTMYDDDELVFAALRAGARGYVLKGAGQEQLVRSIEAVERGEVLFGPGVASRMLRFFRSARGEPTPEAFPDLTEREREVLDQIARGRDNAGIARALGISAKTVRNHVSNVLSKLQVTDRTQAALKAREAGLGEDGRARRPGENDGPDPV